MWLHAFDVAPVQIKNYNNYKKAVKKMSNKLKTFWIKTKWMKIFSASQFVSIILQHETEGMSRVGYRSKIFDVDTDTLSSIPVSERYFFRYQFYEISFNKITLSQKTLVLFFFSLLTFIQLQTQRLISWATAQMNKIYPTQ